MRRADGQPWGLASLCNAWIDKVAGKIVESYTMLTINADEHPLMRRMRKPEPKVGPDQQDKRAVIPVEIDDVDDWLTAPLKPVAGAQPARQNQSRRGRPKASPKSPTRARLRTRRVRRRGCTARKRQGRS